MNKVATDRIHKVLASAGLGSRRQIETWIKAGKVKVNGKLAVIGDRISTRDKVSVNGKKVFLNKILPTATRILAYYKPAGEVCTRSDPQGRKLVFASLPRLNKGRWVNIGRLDINTTGLLLFTNNGDLANQFMHPSYQFEREYAVRVLGKVGKKQIEVLKKGVDLEDGLATFSSITDGGGEGINHWYHVVIQEGRNREVRRLWESQGFKISRLIRIRYGTYSLPRKMRPGQNWELSEKEINKLINQIKVNS